jgi:hypothetical protein
LEVWYVPRSQTDETVGGGRAIRLQIPCSCYWRDPRLTLAGGLKMAVVSVQTVFGYIVM